MATNIIDLAGSLLNESLLSRATAGVGLEDSRFDAASRVAIPAVLAGILQKTTNPARAAELLQAFDDGGAGGEVEGFAAFADSEPDDFEGLTATGQALLASLFGPRSEQVAAAVAEVTETEPAAAMETLALAAPVLLSVLEQEVARRGSDVASFRAVLSEQRREILSRGVDSRITTAMGFDDLHEAIGSLPPLPERASEAPAHSSTAPGRGGNGWRWVVAVGSSGLAFALFANWFATQGRSVARTQRTFAASAASGPAAERADAYFAADQSAIDEEARSTLAAVAESALGNGRAVIVTSFVRASADAPERKLAARRAAMIRDALLSLGMPEEDVVVMPVQSDADFVAESLSQRVQVSMLP